MRTLLAVHAHPDDETITMGGTLARYSAQGVRTVVVTCTRGDLGWILDPSLVGQDVASLRERELEAAARTLGVSRVRQLGYADSGLAGAPENHRPGAFFAAPLPEACERLLDIIREERPQVLVAYDETGGYGHPDHIKSHQVAVAAWAAAGQARPKKLYFVRFPLTWVRDFVRSLRDAGIDAPSTAPAGTDVGTDEQEMGVADELAGTAVDVRKYVHVKRAALACYASQLPPSHFLRRMPLELAERLWAYEFYSLESDGSRRVTDDQREADLFAGLD